MPCSLSNKWNVARLTSAISSSFRTKRCSDQLLSACGISAVGCVAADALPTSESPIPAPSAVKAADLAVRFCFEARLTRGMAASSESSANVLAVASEMNCKISRPVPIHLHEIYKARRTLESTLSLGTTSAAARVPVC